MIKQAGSTPSKISQTPAISIGLAESRLRNDRQAIFALTRDLVHAQFELADHELTKRLWQEISNRKIDIDRIINLMYGCSCYDDDDAMLDADLLYEKNKRAH